MGRKLLNAYWSLLNGGYGGYSNSTQIIENMEREMGLEPTTSSLGKCAMFCFQLYNCAGR
jgi:hypothetical protein